LNIFISLKNKISHNQAVKAFKRFDKKKNKKLDAKEFKNALEHLYGSDAVSNDNKLVTKIN